jgi:arsenate reductase (glutaredoxin)
MHVVISGASKGIGRELSLAYAKKGCSVAILARNGDLLKTLAKEIEQVGGKALALPCDVANETIVRECVAKSLAKFGPIDLLIANAGIESPGKPGSISLPQVKKIYDVNVFGLLNLVSAALPGMVARHSGHIVAISSIASFRGMPRNGAYCASKAAVNMHMEALRNEVSKLNINVSTICPGFIKTEMTDNNNFTMPFLISTEKAVKLMVNAITKKRKKYVFPWKMKLFIKALYIAPDFVFDLLASQAVSRNQVELTLYHNPDCSKSRKAHDLLTTNRVKFKVHNYIEKPLSTKRIESICRKLEIRPKELLRTKEPVFSTLSLDLENDNDVISAIHMNPVLMERPILSNSQKAAIGRPTENIFEIIQ